MEQDSSVTAVTDRILEGRFLVDTKSPGPSQLRDTGRRRKKRCEALTGACARLPSFSAWGDEVTATPPGRDGRRNEKSRAILVSHI